MKTRLTKVIMSSLALACASVCLAAAMYADTPTAVATTSNITRAGTFTYSFTVTYTAAAGINVSTLNNGDICLVDPEGNLAMTTFVSVNDNTNGTPRVATYSYANSWSSADNGTYAVLMHPSQVFDLTGTPVPEADIGSFTVAIGTPTPTPTPATLGNISTRLEVETGDRVAIAGFIVQGTAPKRVMIRGIGPSLVSLGVPNALANPQLELHNSTSLIGTNNDWQTTQIGGVITSDQVTDISNSGLAPTNALESAMIATLSPGNYTAILEGANSGTGVGLVEVYDLNAASASLLANVSTRGFVGTGDNVMIGGIIVVTQPTRVIVRAIGPSLTPLGVPGALANPQLELHDTNGTLIGQNDDWQMTQIGGIITTNQVAEIQSSGLAPTNPAESAIIATLPPANYTAIVRGVNNTTGNALVEVYDVQ